MVSKPRAKSSFHSAIKLFLSNLKMSHTHKKRSSDKADITSRVDHVSLALVRHDIKTLPAPDQRSSAPNKGLKYAAIYG